MHMSPSGGTMGKSLKVKDLAHIRGHPKAPLREVKRVDNVGIFRY